VIGRVLIIGRGSLGKLVARILRERGIDVTMTSGRSPSSRAVRSAEVVLLAVPDPSIREVAERIAPSIERATVVLHAAGSRRVDELDSLRARGAHVGVMHPLVSFARGAKPSGFAGAVTVIDGDAVAAKRASELARLLETKPVHAAVHGPAYHAAAVLVANGAVALVHEAARILVASGFDQRDAERGLAGLLATVVDNVRSVGVPEALTGPIARGDGPTVRAHRNALTGEARETYEAVAPAILRCSIARGLARSGADSVRTALAERATPPRRTKRRSTAPSRS